MFSATLQPKILQFIFIKFIVYMNKRIHEYENSPLRPIVSKS